MKKILGLVLSLFLLLMAPVSAEEQDIVDIAVGNEDFSILVEALTEANLVTTLQGEGPFTVFAPTNAAFAALLDDLGVTKEQLLAREDLADILLYHVVAGKVMSTDLEDGMTPATVNGATITVSIEGETVMINESTVTTANVEASNGVIHIIDKVLLPPTEEVEEFYFDTVVDIALSDDDNFSILVAALTKADLVGALQGEGPFTVFAPTNAAFAALLEALDITAEQLLDQPDLDKILLYHVVSGRVLSTDLSEGMTPETLNGETITISLDGGVFINDSEVVIADLQAANGVVHVIDAVLVPENIELVLPEAEEDEEILIVDTSDNNMIGWIILTLSLGAGLVIISQPKLKKES